MAKKKEEAAELYIRILNFVSATQAKLDKAYYITHLRDLKAQYPNIETALQINATATL